MRNLIGKGKLPHTENGEALCERIAGITDTAEVGKAEIEEMFARSPQEGFPEQILGSIEIGRLLLFRAFGKKGVTGAVLGIQVENPLPAVVWSSSPD